ncbi:hypothetical protein J4457_03185 [Candidatus Woesearchaeota archaeon]|nr:hypothetical protein [Candidatus Woesearchaeota archaeon]
MQGKHAIFIVSPLVLFAVSLWNATFLTSLHKIAEWLLVIIGIILFIMLARGLQRRRSCAMPCFTLFFSVALLNTLFLYLLTNAVYSFFVASVFGILGLFASLLNIQVTKRKKRKEQREEYPEKNEIQEQTKELGLPQMLDSVPQNEPQVMVELETYSQPLQPVVALGNEKVRRAKRVVARKVKRVQRKSRKK